MTEQTQSDIRVRGEAWAAEHKLPPAAVLLYEQGYTDGWYDALEAAHALEDELRERAQADDLARQIIRVEGKR